MTIPVPKSSFRSTPPPTFDLTDFEQEFNEIDDPEVNIDDILQDYAVSLRVLREESPDSFAESFLEELSLLLESLTQTERPRVGRWFLLRTATKPILWPERGSLIRARAAHLVETIESLQNGFRVFLVGSVEADFFENTKRILRIILSSPQWVCDRYLKGFLGIASILSSDTPVDQATPAHHAPHIP